MISKSKIPAVSYIRMSSGKQDKSPAKTFSLFIAEQPDTGAPTEEIEVSVVIEVAPAPGALQGSVGDPREPLAAFVAPQAAVRVG